MNLNRVTNCKVRLGKEVATNLYQNWNGDKYGEYEHSSEAVQVQGASSCPIHQRYGHQGHADHDGTDAYRGEFGTLVW